MKKTELKQLLASRGTNMAQWSADNGMNVKNVYQSIHKWHDRATGCPSHKVRGMLQALSDFIGKPVSNIITVGAALFSYKINNCHEGDLPVVPGDDTDPLVLAAAAAELYYNATDTALQQWPAVIKIYANREMVGEFTTHLSISFISVPRT